MIPTATDLSRPLQRPPRLAVYRPCTALTRQPRRPMPRGRRRGHLPQVSQSRDPRPSASRVHENQRRVKAGGSSSSTANSGHCVFALPNPRECQGSAARGRPETHTVVQKLAKKDINAQSPRRPSRQPFTYPLPPFPELTRSRRSGMRVSSKVGWWCPSDCFILHIHAPWPMARFRPDLLCPLCYRWGKEDGPSSFSMIKEWPLPPLGSQKPK